MFCRNYGDVNVPDCLKVIDERHTMNFDDIGQDPIHFCSNCGPREQAMADLLTNACRRGGELARKKIAAMIEGFHEENRKKEH